MPEIRQKVYDPDKDKSYTKAKATKCRKNAGNSGFIEADLSSSFLNFPTEDSAFKEDFSVLPVFVPTDTLDHFWEAMKKCTANGFHMTHHGGMRSCFTLRNFMTDTF